MLTIQTFNTNRLRTLLFTIRNLGHTSWSKMSTKETHGRRGAFLVVEGVDRTGKTTQCKLLVDKLRAEGIKAEYYNFPARHTDIGQVINSYLSSKKDLSDEAIHLLFSANRWECSQHLKDLLAAGTNLVVDRYCYSGVAFSAAKGLSINWCKASDMGLPRPDKVFFLTLPADKVETRNGFGTERYEVPKFQKEVLKNFKALEEDNWEILNADKTIEDLNDELLKRTMEVMSTVGSTPLNKMWENQI